MKNSLCYLTLFAVIIVFITGCSNEHSSYASLLTYNNQQFIGKETVPIDQYTVLEKLGSVSQKVANDQLPADQLSANELVVGTEIYKTDDGKLLAKINDEQYKVFELRK